jgi:hypothetical protein
MEGDRKYRQHGYRDSESFSSNGPRGDDRPRPQGPRPPIDVTGPRLPRMVQSVTAARCYNCSITLPTDIDFRGNCPKCNTALHCCKQCAHFEPSTRFQCLKPIPARISPKDAANQCELFKPRVTVARDSAAPQTNGFGSHGPSAAPAAPPNASNARAVFDSLFKKPE